MAGKTILVLSATAGAGHVRAGEALQATARFLKLPAEVIHEDVLSYTTPLFRKVYAESYYAVVKKSPELWGYLYRKTGEYRSTKSPLLRFFDRVNYRRYVERLKDLRPSAVICTHFLPYQAVTGELSGIPVYSVPTDYYAHALWCSPSVRRYFVASAETAWLLRAYGIDPARVEVTGIPSMPAFRSRKDMRAARRELSLEQERFTILFISGGYGIGAIDRLVPEIARFFSEKGRESVQLLVVCGKNKSLYERLRRAAYPKKIAVRIYPFVDFVDRLMDAADLLVTKSGGLTTTEALNKQLPTVIFDPLPGQEAYNAQFLVEQGAGTIAMNEAYLRYRLLRLFDDPERLASMR